MPKTSTFLEELLAAARGAAAIVAGDRRAASYFDFSLRGLAGSFIAFLAATTFSAFLPVILGEGDAQLSAGHLLVFAGGIFASQVGFSALLLRQINRLDGFVPYVVADNWATFFLTVLSSIFALFGISGDFVLVVLALLVLVIEINIARLIVTLSPWQIAMFIVAQLVGATLGLFVLGAIFPLPPSLLSPGG